MTPQALVDLFHLVMPRDVEQREMGGSPAGIVNGNMFMRVRKQQFVLRLSEADRAELAQLPGTAAFEPVPGRPMTEYVVLPEEVLRDQQALSGWVKRSLAYTRGLAPQAGGGVPQAKPRKQEAKTMQLKKVED